MSFQSKDYRDVVARSETQKTVKFQTGLTTDFFQEWVDNNPLNFIGYDPHSEHNILENGFQNQAATFALNALEQHEISIRTSDLYRNKTEDQLLQVRHNKIQEEKDRYVNRVISLRTKHFKNLKDQQVQDNIKKVIDVKTDIEIRKMSDIDRSVLLNSNIQRLAEAMSRNVSTSQDSNLNIQGMENYMADNTVFGPPNVPVNQSKQRLLKKTNKALAVETHLQVNEIKSGLDGFMAKYGKK